MNSYEEARKEKAKQTRRKKRELGLYLNPNLTHSYAGNGYSEFVYMAVRGIGKTVIGLETAIQLKNKYGWENVKCYYFRLTDASIKALLKPDKAVDPYLIAKYDMMVTKKGNQVFDHGRLLYEAYPLTSAANVGKGINMYDCNWFGQKDENGKLIKRYIVTILDEFMQDEGVSKKALGDPYKQYMIYREAIFRDAERTFNKYNYNGAINFFLANNVSESANFLGQMFNYIPNPNEHEVVKLTRKHAIVWNIPITEAKKEAIAKSFNSAIIKNDDPNYANVERDLTMIKPKKVQIHKVTKLIKFSKWKSDWFCLYDDKYIRKYHNETVKDSLIVGMYRNIEKTLFNQEQALAILEMNDVRYFNFADIISMASWQARMKDYKSK